METQNVTVDRRDPNSGIPFCRSEFLTTDVKLEVVRTPEKEHYVNLASVSRSYSGVLKVGDKVRCIKFDVTNQTYESLKSVRNVSENLCYAMSSTQRVPIIPQREYTIRTYFVYSQNYFDLGIELDCAMMKKEGRFYVRNLTSGGAAKKYTGLQYGDEIVKIAEKPMINLRGYARSVDYAAVITQINEIVKQSISVQHLQGFHIEVWRKNLFFKPKDAESTEQIIEGQVVTVERQENFLRTIVLDSLLTKDVQLEVMFNNKPLYLYVHKLNKPYNGKLCVGDRIRSITIGLKNHSRKNLEWLLDVSKKQLSTQSLPTVEKPQQQKYLKFAFPVSAPDFYVLGIEFDKQLGIFRITYLKEDGIAKLKTGLQRQDHIILLDDLVIADQIGNTNSYTKSIENINETLRQKRQEKEDKYFYIEAVRKNPYFVEDSSGSEAQQPETMFSGRVIPRTRVPRSLIPATISKPEDAEESAINELQRDAQILSQSEHQDAESHSQSEHEVAESHSQSEHEDAESQSQSQHEDTEPHSQNEHEDVESHSQSQHEDAESHSQSKHEGAESQSQSQQEDTEPHSQSQQEDTQPHSQSKHEDAESHCQSGHEDAELHSQSEESSIESKRRKYNQSPTV